jgi:hypothetical protein
VKIGTIIIVAVLIMALVVVASGCGQKAGKTSSDIKAKEAGAKANAQTSSPPAQTGAGTAAGKGGAPPPGAKVGGGQ